ncbi:hypothetical protein OBB00_07080 [Gammaproteobacteria bacterium]|nr:hypothetical protein [Gammaproteobacteria bacterium]
MLEYDFTHAISVKNADSNLYTWHIREEIDADTRKAKKYIPFFLSSSFKVEAIAYQPTWKREQFEELFSYKFDSSAQMLETEMIRGYLLPNEEVMHAKYSMFGTSRPIEKFGFEIRVGSNERVHIRGFPRSTGEIDFEDLNLPDFLWLHIFVDEAKFAKIADMVSRDAITSMVLSISHVKGFYAEWTPDIDVDTIKVLTPDHKLEVPTECDVDLPFVGDVGDFSFAIYSHRDLLSTPSDDSSEQHKSGESLKLSDTEPPAKAAASQALQEEMKEQLILMHDVQGRIRQQLVMLRESNEEQNERLRQTIVASAVDPSGHYQYYERLLGELASLRRLKRNQQRLLSGILVWGIFGTGLILFFAI